MQQLAELKITGLLNPRSFPWSSFDFAFRTRIWTSMLPPPKFQMESGNFLRHFSPGASNIGWTAHLMKCATPTTLLFITIVERFVMKPRVKRQRCGRNYNTMNRSRGTGRLCNGQSLAATWLSPALSDSINLWLFPNFVT